MLELVDTANLELPQDKLIRRLAELLSEYLDQEHVDFCMDAYQFGADAHIGQIRKSGEAYICHPVSVAISLAEIRMDANCIAAAILHDVLEDTSITKEQISTQFNPDVAELVDGVTKLTQIDSKSRAETQAENVRKMFLAMAKDLRVIMVKLADRLHNMKTLGVMPPEKKRRIARETLDIYAPIANRLGMNKIRQRLETLCFEAIYPKRYQLLKEAVKKVKSHRFKAIDPLESIISKRMKEVGLNCEVSSRERNLYSIYQKLLSKKISLIDIFDVFAFRLYCDNVDTCYRALGVLHNLYNPIPGRFKDYIALPKANGYQSLHTVLMGPSGMPIEIQIRTHEMHRMAESGIAAHWLYKSDGDKPDKFQASANEWLREMLEIQKSSGDPLEFIDNLKVDLFPQEVYVFTPKGEIVKIPRGSTTIDFAYAVHTDIGNSCVSAKIDKQLVPLQTTLENGMTVEIITASWARPNPLWLKYVSTAKARSGIRNYLKNFKQKEAISLGRRLLEKELNSMDLKLEAISVENIQGLLGQFGMSTINELYEDIGLGNKMPFLIATRIVQNDDYAGIQLESSSSSRKAPLIIKGTEGVLITLAKCCRPIPGDLIIGFFNPGKGIVVHHHECHNVNDDRKKHNSWLDVEWSQNIEGEFPCELRIEIMNERGALATIASVISEQNSNIQNVHIVDQDERVCVDLITFTVTDRTHLAAVMRRLKKLPIVLKITRTRG